jgi:homoserine kinase type II
MQPQQASTIVSPATFEYLNKILQQNYDLGGLQRAHQNHRGYINVNYEIEMVSQGITHRYFMRFYRQGVLGAQVRFEHQLLAELVRGGFTYSPRVIETRHGKYSVSVADPFKDGNQSVFVSLFSFVEGQDKYAWNAPECPLSELRDSARVLATYHGAIHTWQGPTTETERFIDKLDQIPGNWKGYSEIAGDTPFDDYFRKIRGEVMDSLGYLTCLTDRTYYDKLPHLVVHGDFHPGNLKFEAGKVSALIDFDWSHGDARCYDVALAIYYFCTSWQSSTDGRMDLEKIEHFQSAYQTEAARQASIGPLSGPEMENLAGMIYLSSLFIIDWTVDFYYAQHPDPEEYLGYLRHCSRHLRWMRRNKQELTQCLL